MALYLATTEEDAIEAARRIEAGLNLDTPISFYSPGMLDPSSSITILDDKEPISIMRTVFDKPRWWVQHLYAPSLRWRSIIARTARVLRERGDGGVEVLWEKLEDNDRVAPALAQRLRDKLQPQDVVIRGRTYSVLTSDDEALRPGTEAVAP